MEYLSEWRRRMAPILGTLAPPSTDGTWGMAAMGVIGAVGVVGVWGKLGGDVEGKFLDMVTLDTKFSCSGKEKKALFFGFSDRAECLLSSSLTQLCFH